MKLKVNLHMHTKDDPMDFIRYSLKEAVDRAHKLTFDVLALTCHAKWAWREEYAEYAESKGILLIPGIELSLGGKSPLYGYHTVVLGCERSIENVRTLDDLRVYKENHPDIFILAPHPFYPYPFEQISLFSYLERHIDVFDAIEFSWFYSKWVNGPNKKAERIARKYNLPFIATSDTHFIERLNFGHAVIEVEEKTAQSIFKAIRDRDFVNVSEPRKFWREMIGDYIIKKMIGGDLIAKKMNLGYGRKENNV